jgi:FkbM family methyltransferase
MSDTTTPRASLPQTLRGAPDESATERTLKDVVRDNASSMLRTMGHLWPFEIGCGRLAQTAPFEAAEPTEGDIACQLRDGTTVYTMPGDFVGRALYYFGDLDPKISWLLRELVREGDTVVDIGANLGLYTFLAANQVGATGTVHAIEPQHQLVRLLSRSKETNDATNVKIHPVAFGDTNDTMKLFVPAGNAGAASLCRKHEPDGQWMPVPVVHAGQYLQLMQLDTVRFMKIDIEGYESTVLRAAAGMLAETTPDYIVAEVGPDWPEPDERDMFGILRELGYDLYNIPRTPLRNVVERFEDGETPVTTGHDVLAARSDDRDAVAASLAVQTCQTT